MWYKKHEKDFNTEWTVEEDGKLYATRTILDTATTSRRIGVLRAEFYLNRILEPFDTMDYLDNGIVIKDGNGQVSRWNRKLKCTSEKTRRMHPS